MKNKRGIASEKILKRYSKLKVPISALRKRPLTTYEALIVYLKEEMRLNYHNAGVLLDRDERDIWTIYSRAKKKV